MSANHIPLAQRQNALGHDVAEAISLIVGDPPQVPVAMHKGRIAQQLVSMASMDSDGTPLYVPPIALRAMGDAFMHRLTTTGIFQAGYKRFEEWAQLPIVPVSDYFFQVVVGKDPDGDLMVCIDAMTGLELQHSLPKRPSPAKTSDGDADYVRNADGQAVVFGDVQGIVVFPANSKAYLLAAWLQRLAATTKGTMNSLTERVGYARPDSASVQRLRDAGDDAQQAMRRALPRPKS